MDIRRGTATVLFATLIAGTALAADHPGALWSIARLDVRADGASPEQVGKARLALMRANETYFYGDRPVRMVARVSADGAVRVDVIDAASGALLVTGARLDDLGRTALAWMDGLDCSAGRCDGNTAQTQLAAVADQALETVAKAMRPAKPSAQAEAAWPKSVIGVLPRMTAAAPLPKPRPGGAAARAGDLAGLRKVAIARNPGPVPDSSVPPIRISRFDTRGLGPISYDANDTMVLGEPRTLAPATRALPKPPTPRAPETLVGRLVDRVAALLGISDTGDRAPKTIAAVRAPQPVVSSYAPEGTPLRPAPRWSSRAETQDSAVRLAALDTSRPGGVSRLPIPQVAAPAPAASASTSADVVQDDAVQTPVTRGPRALLNSGGIRVLPSPGLGLPRAAAEPVDAVQVTPIRLSSVSGQPRSPNKNLAVKLHPDVFGRYSTAAAERLFGSYGRPNAPLRLVGSDGDGGPSVDRVLARRGLALDARRYAKAERIFWSGRTGSRGFWISLPQVLPSNFVLVASSTASVIANVYPRGSSVQVSDAVAKALALNPGQWSDVQIIALKQLDRTAARGSATVAR